MAENNAKKSISVSTVVIIILAVVIVLMLIFGTVIFFMMKSNKEENPATVANTNSQVVAEMKQRKIIRLLMKVQILLVQLTLNQLLLVIYLMIGRIVSLY